MMNLDVAGVLQENEDGSYGSPNYDQVLSRESGQNPDSNQEYDPATENDSEDNEFTEREEITE